MIEHRIEELARRQHGVITRAQLRALGLGDRAVSRRVAKGRLHRLHQGVFRVGPLVGPYGREMAALLACGAGARVSHGSAAWLHDVRPRTPDTWPAEVTVPGIRVVRRPGIRVYRAGPGWGRGPGRGRGRGRGRNGGAPSDEVATVHGIAVTSPGRTLLDLAAVLPTAELERAVARAERAGLVTLGDLARLVARHRGRPGIAKLAGVIGRPEGPALTRSELERRFVDAVRALGFPRPRFNVLVAGHEVDGWFEAERLVVELDGREFHGSWTSQANDRRRDRELAALGIQVIRITWDDLTRHFDKTMLSLAMALIQRRQSASPLPGRATPIAGP
jgi:very-short-patch-repair endonuclease